MTVLLLWILQVLSKIFGTILLEVFWQGPTFMQRFITTAFRLSVGNWSNMHLFNFLNEEISLTHAMQVKCLLGCLTVLDSWLVIECTFTKKFSLASIGIFFCGSLFKSTPAHAAWSFTWVASWLAFLLSEVSTISGRQFLVMEGSSCLCSALLCAPSGRSTSWDANCFLRSEFLPAWATYPC